MGTGQEAEDLVPSVANWLQVGAELDYRAKYFSLLRTGQRDFYEKEEGVVLWEELARQTDTGASAVGYDDWDWVFEPLVRELLASGCAAWVCVGHFTGARREVQRRWLYYLSPNLNPRNLPPTGGPGDSADEFLRFLLATSFNAEIRTLADRHLLLTSELLEKLAITSGPTTIRHGTPFLLNLAREDWSKYSDVDGEQIWKADASRAAGRMKSRERVQLLLPDVNLTEALGASGEEKPAAGRNLRVIPFLWKDDAQNQEVLRNASRYSEALERRFSSTRDDPIVESTFDFARLWSAYKQKDRFAASKLYKYTGWISDSFQDVRAVFTVPAWLPAEGAAARSGALVVSLREAVDYYALLSIANAFKLGCSNWAIASGVEKGGVLAADVAQHETKNVIQDLSRWVQECGEGFSVIEARREPNSNSGLQGRLGRVYLCQESIKAEHLAMVLFPGLLRSGLDYLALWGMSGSPADLPFYKHDERSMPRSFESLTRECWGSALDALVFSVVSSAEPTPSTVNEIALSIEAIRSLFSSDLLDVDAGGFPEFSWEITGSHSHEAARNTWLARLLIHLFREVMQHGDLTEKIRCAAKCDGGFATIVVSNHIGDFERKRELLSERLPGDLVSDFMARLLPARPQRSAGDGSGRSVHGGDVYAYLLSKISAVDCSSEASKSERFVRSFRFSMKGD